MKPFTQIATPHDDIVEGRLTMDVFAADLWQVVKGKAPLDYQDSDIFFRKTHLTKGLKNIIEVAKKRLEGKIGDSVIQLQTPFGGGKTHTLIALYHKAKEWRVNVAVFDGSALDPKEITPWEEIERQLTKKVEITKGQTSPGKEKLIELLSSKSPVLILIDELLEYATKAAGIKVGDSTLAAQTLAFMQELTGAVSSIGNALAVVTLPSSVLEHYDENAEKMFQKLQKILGRTEKIYNPVEEDEIADVVRARLFKKVNIEDAKKIVDEFVEYAKEEGLLNSNEVAEYREKFLKSYPFKPEVIDILYKRWGSFPTFQRTRGVLRLLSLVVHDLLDKNIPYIRLADFNLANEEIRRELIKHIGQEWDSILAQDITSKDSGAKKVDKELGSSYKPYKLGTCVATTIFLMSFSGRGEREVSRRDIKLSVVYPEFSSTVIDTTIDKLKERLFYISDEGLYFTNQPNLNRIITTREENVSLNEIEEEEKRLIKSHISGATKFSVIIYPKFPKDIPDTQNLKLVILNKPEPEKEFLEKYGENPRIYRNNIVFLCVDENQKDVFYSFLRKILAIKSIEKDTTINLTEAQKREIENKLKNYKDREYEELRKCYRKLFIPDKGGELKQIDLGIPTFGGAQYLDKEIYERLKSEGELLEKIDPKVISSKYLAKNDYVEIKNLYEALLKTPGEMRIILREGFLNGVKEGVKRGLFGFGYIKDGELMCASIYEEPKISFIEGEIILKPELCVREEEKEEKKIVKEESTELKPETKPLAEKEMKAGEYSKIFLDLEVPVGKLSNVVRLVNYLSKKFEECTVEVTIKAKNGKITSSEYQDKILEAINQAGIKAKKEEIRF